MGAVTPYTKVKSPNDPSLARVKAYEERTGKKYMGFSSPFAEDRVDDLARARLGYTKVTGRKDLKDVTTTEAYKNFTSSQNKNIEKETQKTFCLIFQK